MRAHLVRVGNSRGLRLPKPLLRQAGLEGDVEIDVERNALVIRPVRRARAGWDDAFARMARRGDDRPMDITEAPTTRWDEDEWRW